MEFGPRSVGAMLASFAFVVLGPRAQSATPSSTDVVVARHGQTVVFHTELDGLLVRRGARFLRLGPGGETRFDADGNLYFVRTVDDGHVELARTLWRLAAAAPRPEPVLDAAAAPPYAPPSPNPSLMATKVCIDAGHGGSDPGAIGNGMQEKAITLDVALRLQRLLVADTADTAGGGAWRVLMTRTTDQFVSLSGRATAANAFGAASFLSIHMNAFSSASANGTETFSYSSTGAGAALRNKVQAESLAAWGLRDRGVKTANFYVLRRTTMPAALAEGGFITNARDAAKLRDPNARQRFALGLLFALQQHHGYPKYVPRTGSPKGRLRGVVYDASNGSSARIAGATVALGDGRFVTTSATGYFEFSLPAGAYSYAGTAPGFTALEARRTLVANADTWGSLALRPGNVPKLSVTPRVAPGGMLGVAVRGDARQPVVWVLHAAPGLPLLDLSSSLGFGVVWPRLTGAVTLGLGSTDGNGSLSVSLRMPAIRDVRGHCQALVRSRGALRLTNGDGFEIR